MKDDKNQQAMRYLALAMNLVTESSDKTAIKNILIKLEKTAKKRLRNKEVQMTAAEEWRDKVKSWISIDRPIDSWKKSLLALDQLAAENKKKMDEIKDTKDAKGSSDTQNQTLFD